MKVDCAVIGGGIIGLSVGMAILRKQPGLSLIVLEIGKAVGEQVPEMRMAVTQ